MKKWNTSNHYNNYQKQLKELYRKQKAVRKYQHECLANEILCMGDTFYVENMNFTSLTRKAKKTEVSEKTQTYKRKKRFGKSVGNRAPSMLLTILERKLKYFNKPLIKIHTQKAKASQFNHETKEYNKKKLNQRWNNINGIKVQRDLYSAYLIMNINEDLESFNEEKCTLRFNEFIKKHTQEIQRLSKKDNLSCMGI